MKKVMFFLAVAGMFSFAACNNNKVEEPAQDTTTMEEPAQEEAPVDSNAIAVDSNAVETPAQN